jgi:hypothetical protein
MASDKIVPDGTLREFAIGQSTSVPNDLNTNFETLRNAINIVNTRVDALIDSFPDGVSTQEVGTGSGSGVLAYWDDLRVAANAVELPGYGAPVPTFFKNDGSGTAFGSSIIVSETDDQWGEIAYAASQDLPGDITISVWVRLDRFTASDQTIVRRASHFELVVEDGTTVVWDVNGADKLEVLSGIAIGQWTHIVGTYDATTEDQHLYINGILAASTLEAGSVTPADNSISVGARDNGSKVVGLGLIDSLAIFAAAWGAARVTTNYNNGAGETLTSGEADIVGLFQFDSDVTDDTGNSTMTWQSTADFDDGVVGGGGSRGVTLKGFPPGVRTSVSFEIQVPHGVKDDENFKPHVHFSTVEDGSTGDAIRWCLEYTAVNVGGVFGDTQILTADTIAAPSSGEVTAYAHHLSPFGTIPGGLRDSAMFVCTLYRDGAHVDDTFEGIACLLEFDMHAKFFQLGSVEEYPEID